MPSIAFGTWTLGNGQGVIDQVDQALNIGFEHIGAYLDSLVRKVFLKEHATNNDMLCNYTDTAQSYRNEEEAGRAFKESGLSRSDVFITTKYSGLDGLDIPSSIDNSLKNVSVQVFHLAELCGPDTSPPARG